MHTDLPGYDYFMAGVWSAIWGGLPSMKGEKHYLPDQLPFDGQLKYLHKTTYKCEQNPTICKIETCLKYTMQIHTIQQELNMV